MKATFISRENNDVKFTMEFTAEEFENAQIKAYQAAKDQFQIDGFRKGKAPRSIIESTTAKAFSLKKQSTSCSEKATAKP